MKQCAVCKQTFFDTSMLPGHRQHVCPPVWEVCVADERPHAWETVYATEADDAACTWLEHVHHGSGIYDTTSTKVLVRRAGDDRDDSYVTRYDVHMELMPSYTAQWIGTE